MGRGAQQGAPKAEFGPPTVNQVWRWSASAECRVASAREPEPVPRQPATEPMGGGRRGGRTRRSGASDTIWFKTRRAAAMTNHTGKRLRHAP
jgi:hypothetical protein